MDSNDLLRQLEDHFRQKYLNIKSHHDQQKAESDKLTDDEWWEKIQAQKQELPPSLRNFDRRTKEEVIQSRHQETTLDRMDVEQMASHEAEELLPHILEYRRENNIDGQITEDEIQIVTMRKHRAFTESALNQFEDRLGQMENPKKRDLLALLIEDGKTHRAEMAQFEDPANLTEEKWEAHSKRLHKRMEQLGQKLQEIRDRH
ncbi:MAG: hypothetical protein JST12_04800 [Armatimonadetes bacterium]|nr:hypothetical protein [Armatimonadota bacterium]MBS1700958.1 hypothetical protein [Armatimonadota bacterium]MBS1728581.1 hypothetical protein [Armatimonadota bacterium]